MYESLLNFLSKWLWEDSKTFLFLESFLNDLWKNNFTFILVIISLLVIFYIIYQLSWGRYVKVKKAKRIRNYWEYIEKEKYTIWLYILFSTPLVLLFFVKWLWLDLLDSLLDWTSYDWENYSGLAILFGYNLDSIAYQYYNTWRYLLLLILFFYSIYYGIMYYTIWNKINNKWEKIKYEPKLKNSLTALAIVIFLLFSTLVDWWLNWIISFFTDQNLHDLIIGWSDKL